MSSFVEESIKSLREKIGDKKVLLALSGGVDSSVAAVLLHKAIGKQLTCIFVDHGLLRKNEGDEVDNSWFDVIDLPPNPMNFANFMYWLSKTVNWDIGVVPLENSNFNKGKSELKYIELSVLGIPGVYSDMEVYNSVVHEPYNGLLAKTEEEWINQIKKLILNKNLRKSIRNNAIKDVVENYSISSRIQKWDMIFNKLIN